MATSLVFVYGTLLRGEPNHHLLAGGTLEGPARTAPRYELVDLGPYPAMLREGSTSIVGEVYVVDPLALVALDEFEGHPELYERIAIRLQDGREALAYVMPRGKDTQSPRIAHGDWRLWSAAPGGASGSTRS